MVLVVSKEAEYLDELRVESGLRDRILVQSPASNDNAARLQIGLVNLMPKPQDPERDFGRLIAHSDIQARLHVFSPSAWLNSDHEGDGAKYRRANHKPLSAMFNDPKINLDGLIISGFGREETLFEELEFWPELAAVLDHAKENINTTLASCWGAHAALYRHHGVEKTYHGADKISGVFQQQTNLLTAARLLPHLPPSFPMPVSRYGRSNEGQILNNPNLAVLSSSLGTGSSIVFDRVSRTFNFTGHFEYPSAQTLIDEYERDVKKELPNVRHPEGIIDAAGVFLNREWTKAMAIGVMDDWLKLAKNGIPSRASALSTPAFAVAAPSN